MSTQTDPQPGPPARPEQWAVDAGPGDVAQLQIPPDARRDRHFEVFCSQRVKAFAEADEAWHRLKVLVNGRLHWTRQLDTHRGDADSLDYRFRYTVPVGESLRVVATSQVHQARRVGLSITAEEDGPG